MSDFLSAGWSIYIASVTIIGIVWCIWLLFSQRKVNVKYNTDGSVADTGHVWDGDLRELNNPLPRWWMWMFLLSCIFGLIYLVLYPGLGSMPGMLGYTTVNSHQEAVVEANNDVQPLYAKYMAMDIAQVAADPRAHDIGQRLFLNYCSQCHGSDAGGAKGFPSLTDGDWLYGGSAEAIKTSIKQGRAGVMPPYAHLGAAKIQNLANYVRSLSGLPVDSAKTNLGAQVFTENCVACHGADGKGNQLLGAPNLTDKTWLYGSSQAGIEETISKGRNAMMPAQENNLTSEKIHLLTAYVWGLSNIKSNPTK